MKWCSLFLTPPFKAVHRTAGRNTSRRAEFTNSGVWFCFKEQKGKGKTKLSENEEEKPWGKNGFSCRVFQGLGVRFIRYQLSSGTEGPPPARRRRLSRCAGPAGGCAAAAAGRGGWRAGPPGSSRRTGSGCTRRRSPASAHGWPGRSPAECLSRVRSGSCRGLLRESTAPPCRKPARLSLNFCSWQETRSPCGTPQTSRQIWSTDTWACGGRRERHTVLGQSVPAGSTTSWHNNPWRL